MLDKRLPVPAYDHLLKLSHTFNLLDARGAVGMTERAECFATMRHLARQVTGEQLLDVSQTGCMHSSGVRLQIVLGTHTHTGLVTYQNTQYKQAGFTWVPYMNRRTGRQTDIQVACV